MKRSTKLWRAVDKEYEETWPDIIKTARAFKACALAQYAHMIVGQDFETKNSWDFKAIVPQKKFSEFMGFMLGTAKEGLHLLTRMMNMIADGTLIKEVKVVKTRVGDIDQEETKVVECVSGIVLFTLLSIV